VALTTAEKAATIIIRAIEKKAKRVMVGPDAKLIRFVSQLSPNLLDAFVLKRARRFRLKSDFKCLVYNEFQNVYYFRILVLY